MILLAAGLAAGATWLLLPARADDRCRALRAPAGRSEAVAPADVEPARLAAMFDLVAAALDAGLPPGHALAAVAAHPAAVLDRCSAAAGSRAMLAPGVAAR